MGNFPAEKCIGARRVSGPESHIVTNARNATPAAGTNGLYRPLSSSPMDSNAEFPTMAQDRAGGHEAGPLPALDVPPYQAIEMKIGEELRRRYELPEDLTPQLLALLRRINGEGE
jgi:hypothetical protein